MTHISLSKHDDGRTIETRVGDLVVIELPENPTTGFRWNETADSSRVADLQVSSLVPCQDETQPDASTAVLGAPGIRHFEYRIARRGTGRLELRYWQEWEGEGSITETFSVVSAAHD